MSFSLKLTSPNLLQERECPPEERTFLPVKRQRALQERERALSEETEQTPFTFHSFVPVHGCLSHLGLAHVGETSRALDNGLCEPCYL